jgi:hypothetical protein
MTVSSRRRAWRVAISGTMKFAAAGGSSAAIRELQVWNHFMEHLTGRRAEKALGKSPVELFPSSRENLKEAALNHALRGEVV